MKKVTGDIMFTKKRIPRLAVSLAAVKIFLQRGRKFSPYLSTDAYQLIDR